LCFGFSNGEFDLNLHILFSKHFQWSKKWSIWIRFYPLNPIPKLQDIPRPSIPTSGNTFGNIKDSLLGVVIITHTIASVTLV